MGPIGSPETSVLINLTPCNNPKDEEFTLTAEKPYDLSMLCLTQAKDKFHHQQ
jgi:hypothetical protein